jgi:hypothetical protein
MAIGGAGGNSTYRYGGVRGPGGAASSTLTFDDTENSAQSKLVEAAVIATGGNAGGGHSTIFREGGVAAGTVTLVGSMAVTAGAEAKGGEDTDGRLAAANASATSNAGGGAAANAIAQTSGGDGSSFAATTRTTPVAGGLITAVSATTSGSISGTGHAEAAVGGGPLAFDSTDNGVAFETASPQAASVANVLAGNGSIAAAFGSSYSIFAIGELGGGAAGATTTAEIDETVDLTKLSPKGNLIIGFYHGQATSSAITGVSFDLYVDGTDVLHESFASGAAAQAFFTNNAVTLGSLASGPLSGNPLTLRAVLTVTGGAGFFGDVIIGDPPAAKAPVLAGAMARFGAGHGGAAGAMMASEARPAPANLMAIHTQQA